MAPLYAIGCQAYGRRQVVTQGGLNARHGGDRLVGQAPSFGVRFGITLADGECERLAQSSTRALQVARETVIAFRALKSVQGADDP